MREEIPGRFRDSDAWVILAIEAAWRRTASLRDIIAAGDYINHAILAAEELDAGLNRLVAAGLVAPTDAGFRLTDAGERLCRSCLAEAGGSYLDALASIREALAHREMPEFVPRSIIVSDDAARAAYDEYFPPPTRKGLFRRGV